MTQRQTKGARPGTVAALRGEKAALEAEVARLTMRVAELEHPGPAAPAEAEQPRAAQAQVQAAVVLLADEIVKSMERADAQKGYAPFSASARIELLEGTIKLTKDMLRSLSS